MSAHATQRLPFPRYSVGLLQSETEMVQAPEHDLLPFLEGDEGSRESKEWDVELFTEATVEALVKSANRFHCIVVGHNAAHKREQVQAALARISGEVGLLVLHQLDAKAFRFLASRRVDAQALEHPVSGAAPRAGGDPHDEILLNWPDAVDLDDDAIRSGLAYVAVTPAGESSWQTVLEMSARERRFPVLLRTSPEQVPPAAISSMLLSPRHASHRALVRNLLMWCCAGSPDAVVLDTPEDPPAAIIHRKLRLQGVKAVVERVESADKLDFESWPLWGTRDALLPQSWDPTQAQGWPDPDDSHAMPWLRKGHRIVLLGADDSVTVRHGESDAHWVARRWATWFKGFPTERWHGPPGDEPGGSIVATRAVLRVLAALHGFGEKSTLPGLVTVREELRRLEESQRKIDAEALGLPRPEAFTERVADLLRRRFGGRDNIDRTVSATVAGLDIDALLDERALSPGQRKRARAGLRKEFPDASLEDRLEIARCLGDRALLDAILAEAGSDARTDQPVSAVLISALRSAIVACNAPSTLELGGLRLDPGRAVVDRELRMRPMLAAGYLLGVLDLQRAWKGQQPEGPAGPLRDPPRERVDRAVITLGRHGPLTRGETGAEGSVPELASTEALALIGYFAENPVPTHVVTRGETVAPGTVTSLLQEAENIRVENEDLLAEKRRREAVSRRGAILLALAGIALILPTVSWLTDALPNGGGVLGLPGPPVLFAVLVLGLFALLISHDLPVPFAQQLAVLVRDGVSGLAGRFASLVERKSQEQGQSDTRG